MKNFLLSFALLILVILLLLPPGLRMFGKNLFAEKKITKAKDELEILSCTKINESISTTFMNGKAYNIKYAINGNHTIETNGEDDEQAKLPDENEILNENEDIPINSLIEDFKDYAEIKYIEDENITEFRISMNLFDSIPEKLNNHAKTIDEVKNYYSELSFSCTSQKY